MTKNKKRIKQTYKYIITNSILGSTRDEYVLSENEYYRLYSFFVTYSMCGTQSAKKRTFAEYGWKEESVRKTLLGTSLLSVLSLKNNSNFIFTEKDDLESQFDEHNLKDDRLENVDKERAVIAKTSESNNYLKLFYRIRNGLAHGKFKLRFSSNREKMIVIQDNDNNNVTARIVIKLATLQAFINTVDRKGLIMSNS